MTAPSESYQAWSQELAQDYWTDLAKLNPDTEGGITPNVPANYVQQMEQNSGLESIYQQGVTPSQIMASPLLHAGLISGTPGDTYGALQHTPPDKLSADQQALVNRYGWTWQDQWTDSSGNVQGGYWNTASGKNPGVMGTNLPASAFTAYDPFNTSQLKNQSQVFYDPNYGLLTTTANQKQNIGDVIGQNLGPILMGALTAGFGALAGGGGWIASLFSKIPSLEALTSGGSRAAPASTGSTTSTTKAPASNMGGILPVILLLAAAASKGKGSGGH